MLHVDRDQVLAFRLNGHHLAQRLPEGSLLVAAGACGVQNSPPGSAALALHARVDGLTPEQLDRAVEIDKRLLQSWCMRGAPFFFPTDDTPVFTVGVLPDGEEARQQFILGVAQGLDRLGMGLGEAVERTEAEIAGVLSGRRLAITELGAELAERIAPRLPAAQRRVWLAEGPWGAGQPLGEGVVHFALRVLTLKRVVCFAPRQGNKAPFILTQEWLGKPPPDAEPEQARAELVRRYLRCYGPAVPEQFAIWVGVPADAARRAWRLVERELHEVEFGGRPAWLLAADVEVLVSPSQARGVRLLPPRDPYIQQPDRRTVIPDQTVHHLVWRKLGEPGTVLIEGRVVALWRPRKQGKRLRVDVTPIAAVTENQQEQITAEAASLAPFRGAAKTEVSFAS